MLFTLVLVLHTVAAQQQGTPPSELPRPATLSKPTPAAIPPPRPEIRPFDDFDTMLPPGWDVAPDISQVREVMARLDADDIQRGPSNAGPPQRLRRIVKRARAPASKTTTTVKVTTTAKAVSSSVKPSSTVAAPVPTSTVPCVGASVSRRRASWANDS